MKADRRKSVERIERFASRRPEGIRGSYELARPPVLTPEMASARWKDVNRLLHCLVVLRADLKERRSLTRFLRSARALAGADRALLLVRNLPEGEWRVLGEDGFPSRIREPITGSPRLAALAISSRKPQIVTDPPEEALAEELKRTGGASCLTVPILPEGSPWGALQLLREARFAEEDGILAWIYVLALEEALGCDAPQFPARDIAPVSREAGEWQALPAFLRRLEEEMARAAWTGRPFSILQILWSPPGPEKPSNDERLGRAAVVARRTLRPGAPLFRGEEGELLVILAGDDAPAAQGVCASLRRNLVQSRALGAGSRVIQGLHVSSVTFPRDGRNREELLGRLRTGSSATTEIARS